KGTTSSATSFIRASIMAIFIGLTSYVYDGQATSVAILVFFAVVLIYCLFIVFKVWKNL
ncbi:MFS transporter, partial [Wolbachia endosymbiont of Aedes albopictus]